MADQVPADQQKAAVQNTFGLPPEFMDTLSDEQLQILVNAVLAQQAGGGAPAEEAMQDDAAAMSREELIAALTELGQDPAALEGMTDDELRALYQQLTGGGTATMSENTPPAPAPPPALPAAAQRAFREALGTLRRERAALRADLAASARLRRDQQADDRARRVAAACDRLKAEHKVTPAEVDAGPDGQPGPVRARLLRADPVAVVRTFTENGKAVRLTELDLQLRELDQRPPLHGRLFAEQIPQGPASRGAALTPERRRELLGYTRLGKTILKQERKGT
jgi:hypothetical protein